MRRTFKRVHGRVFLTILALACTPQAHAEPNPTAPLAVRNLAPFSGLYGVPRMRGAGSAQGVSVALDQVSNFSSSNDGATQIFQDGETSVLRLTAARAFADERIDVGVELPWVRHSGGELDRYIDGFHRAFGLPEGGRENAPRNQLDLLLRVAGETEVRRQDSGGGLGDTVIWGGYALLETDNRAVRARAQLKLPTGDAAEITGSGGLDLSAWVELFDQQLLASLKTDITAGIGMTYLGAGDLAPAAQKRWVPIAHFGIHRALGRWLFTGQLDAHGALFDLSVDQLGEPALLGTLGVRRPFGEGQQLTVSLVEDLIGQSTSDVVFQLAWEKRW
ncbi:MAG: DUF3187 family protein [Pseudomonadota bacterium]